MFLISKIFWLIAQPLSFSLLAVIAGLLATAIGWRRIGAVLGSLGALVLFLSLFTTTGPYALQALERHGAWGGTVCSLARLARCHPWCRGGHDPVPERPFGLFSRLLAPPAPSSSPSSSSTEKTAP